MFIAAKNISKEVAENHESGFLCLIQVLPAALWSWGFIILIIERRNLAFRNLKTGGNNRAKASKL
jgi:hypothetical protein